jgi:uncharacterized protein (DUF1810 family)
MEHRNRIEETYNLERFLTAQEYVYQTALSEVSSGRKQSHWMWFIFPQIQGLGFSDFSKYYAIKDLKEAEAYVQHPVLGSRLLCMCKALLNLESNDAHYIFGSPDDVKLKSSMTLFSSVANADPIFQAVLDKCFDGEKDRKTLRRLEQQQ